MGNNFGQSLTALLTGLAQGHGEATQEDKLKKQKEKLAGEERLFKIAGLLAEDPNSSAEIKRIALQAMAGQKEGLKQLKEGLGTGLVTIPTPGKTGSALQSASPELPSVEINKEGKLARDHVLPDIASPPPPTQEARDRQVITESGTREIPLFRDPKELAQERGEFQAIENRPAQEQTAEINRAEDIAREQRNLLTTTTAEARDLVRTKAAEQRGTDRVVAAEQRKLDAEDKLIATKAGLAEELISEMLRNKDMNRPQAAIVVGMMKTGIPFSTALNSAGVDFGKGQSIVNKFAAIEEALGSKLSASEKKRFLGIESIADPASRLITSRVGNTLVGTVWDPSTKQFKTHILKQFDPVRKPITEVDINGAEEAIALVMGEVQWANMDFVDRQANVENYLSWLQIGRAPQYAAPIEVDESFWVPFTTTTRPSMVLPVQEDDPESDADRFDENNPG